MVKEVFIMSVLKNVNKKIKNKSKQRTNKGMIKEGHNKWLKKVKEYKMIMLVKLRKIYGGGKKKVVYKGTAEQMTEGSKGI